MPSAPAGREAGDAPPRVRAGSRRLFVIALLVAVVAHLPALPFDPLFLARILLHTAAPPPPPAAAPEEEVLVPVDLDLLADTPRTEDAPPPPNQATSEPAASAAGDAAPAPAATPEPAAEPAAPKTAPAVAAPKADDIYDELDKPKRGTPTVKNALEVAGGPGKFGFKSPHVQVLFNGNRLRSNTAGAALGGVLTALPEWKSFFEGTKIDPIADSEHLLIAGPQFRRSKDVVVWMQYRGSEADMRAAIDTLVKRSGKRGRWLEDSPVPAAVAVAHKSRRIFALVPGKKLLAILPATTKDQLAKLKAVRPFNNTSKVGIVISLDTPRNAFAGYDDVVDVPKSFKWMRMIVTPLDDGSADVTLEIGDASAEAAATNGPLVEKQLAQVRTLASLATIIGAEVLPPMKVEVDHDILRVKAKVSRKGLNHILNLARTHFSKKAAGDSNLDEDIYDDDEPSDKKDKSPPASPSATTSGSAAPSSEPAPGGKRKIKIPRLPRK